MSQLLHKGRTSALLDNADLRYVTVDGVEVLRRVYVTVRDAAWGTPPVTALDVTLRETPDAIHVEAAGEQGEGDVTVSWTATASIHADGSVQYRVAVSPRGEFAFNRIGLCVLHPPATCAGRPYRATEGADVTEGVLPQLIAPAHLPAFDGLEVDVDGLGPARLVFTGDLFELEDQRNWSDGSFKTYCTPLSRPLPQHARPGSTIEQAVALTAPASARAAAAAGGTGPIADTAVELTVGEPTGHAVPELGLGLGAPLDASTAQELLTLAPAHLRVDLRAPERYEAVLGQAVSDAARLGCPVALALHLGDDPDAELAQAAALLSRSDLPVVRVLAFSRLEPTSTGAFVTRAREQLAPLLPAATFAGGTDVWFIDLNGTRPDPSAMDAVAWSITPQVHGDDELTMVEALAAQTDQVASARAFAGGLPLLAGPITLRPRYNPHAPDAAAQALDPPPASIDPRQGEPFAAAWTAGSLAALARAGADVATYFETAGARGVVAPGRSGLLPCGTVLAAAARWRGWDVLATSSSAPLRADALIARSPTGGGVEGMLVNLTDTAQRIGLSGLGEREPQFESLSGGDARGELRDGAFALELPAWGVALLRTR